jgi:hypothetical protein
MFSCCMRTVSHERKFDDYFFPEFLSLRRAMSLLSNGSSVPVCVSICPPRPDSDVFHAVRFVSKETKRLVIPRNYWVFGLFPSSGVFGSRNTTFRKLDLFPSSGEGGGEDTLSQSLSKVTNWLGVFSPVHLRTETDPVSKRRVSTPKNTGRWKKSRNPVILWVLGCITDGIEWASDTSVQ